MDSRLKLDRIRGAFAAHFLGDALGGPYEFYWGQNRSYTDLMSYPLEFRSRWQDPKVGMVGQTTDDTAMTLALFEHLLESQGSYNFKEVVKVYHQWAIGAIMVGSNTRELIRFKAKPENVYTCYQRRWNRKFTAPETAENQQSNGCLMRCLPLALLKTWEEAARQDCFLTNPSELAWECNFLYLAGMKKLMRGVSGEDVYHYIREETDFDEVFNLTKEDERDLTKKKGWCINAFWCFLQALLWEESPSDFYKYLALQKGDTDTNMAIAGAALGARLGFEELMEYPLIRQNWDILTKVDISESDLDSRKQYQGRDLLTELQSLGFTD